MKRIVLHIDRLVLRGVNHRDAPAVAAALQAELRQLLGPHGDGTLAAQGSTHALRAGRVLLPPGADGAALGQAVAGRIARAGSTAPPPHGGPA